MPNSLHAVQIEVCAPLTPAFHQSEAFVFVGVLILGFFHISNGGVGVIVVRYYAGHLRWRQGLGNNVFEGQFFLSFGQLDWLLFGWLLLS